MKILVTSDWHPDWVTAGMDRFCDVQEAVGEMLEAATGADGSEKVDAFMFLGDLCNPSTHRVPRSIALAVRVAEVLHEEDIDQFWMPGNHDVIEDGNGESTLTVLSELSYILVHTMPGLTLLGGSGGPNVFALPFTPRSHDYDPEAVLRELASHGVKPDIIAGHLNIEGITPGSETKDMPRGRNVYFPYDVARELFPDALLLNGHYHTRQVWKGRSGRNTQGIHIPGSLVRLMRAEKDNPTGWLIIDTEGGE